MPAAIALDDTLGAVLIALVLSAVLYGIICQQAYYYYAENSEGDRFFLRILVATLIGLETFQLVMQAHTAYVYTITDFGAYEDLTKTVWSYHWQVIVVDAVEFLVQGFFAWRIYSLSERINWLLPAAIIACAIGTTVTGLMYMVKGIQYHTLSKDQELVPWAVASYSCSMTADALVTGGMIYYLSKMKVHSFTRTKRSVHTLMIYSINTGLITTIFNVLTLAMLAAYKTKLIFAPFFCIMARLYACALLSLLNSRKTVRAQLKGSARPGVTNEAYMFSEMGSQGIVTTGHVPAFVSPFSAQNTQVYVASSKEVHDV